MKTVIVLATLLVAFNGFANEKTAWKNEMFCGSYKHTTDGYVTFDASKYGVSVGAAEDKEGVRRELELYENHADGSNLIQEEFGCTKSGNILTCAIGDVVVNLDVTQKPETYVYGNNKNITYKAKISVPILLIGMKTYQGTCRTSITLK